MNWNAQKRRGRNIIAERSCCYCRRIRVVVAVTLMISFLSSTLADICTYPLDLVMQDPGGLILS